MTDGEAEDEEQGIDAKMRSRGEQRTADSLLPPNERCYPKGGCEEVEIAQVTPSDEMVVVELVHSEKEDQQKTPGGAENPSDQNRTAQQQHQIERRRDGEEPIRAHTGVLREDAVEDGGERRTIIAVIPQQGLPPSYGRHAAKCGDVGLELIPATRAETAPYLVLPSNDLTLVDELIIFQTP